MSAELPENARELTETQEKPTPAVPSPVSAVTPSAPSLDADLLANALANPKVRGALVETLRPEWQKDSQSVKDKRIAGLTDDVERLKAYMKATGGDVDAAVREMRIDDVLEGRASPDTVRGRTVPESQDEAYMKARSAQILNDAQISFDDPEYGVLVAQYQGRVNPAQWVDIVANLANSRQKKATKQTGVTAAAAVGGGAAAAPGSGDVDALTAELEAIQAGQRGSLTDPKLREKRKELRTQIAALTPQRPDIR